MSDRKFSKENKFSTHTLLEGRIQIRKFGNEALRKITGMKRGEGWMDGWMD
jgi:hypothetical protein